VLLKDNATNYFLDLFVPGKAGQLQFTDLANISPVSGESPMLVTGDGADVYVLLVSSPSATTTHAQIIDFTVGPNNIFNPNPARTAFTLTGSIASMAAFPQHMLYFLLANGSVVSLQAGGTSQRQLVPTPVMVPSPLAPPLAASGAAFTATMPVPTPHPVRCRCRCRARVISQQAASQQLWLGVHPICIWPIRPTVGCWI
jgi:hypothetical protein